MPWTNIMNIAVNDFATNLIPASFGLGSDTSIAGETVQLTSIDKTSKVRWLEID